MYTTTSESLDELEREAYETNNRLALTLISKIDEIIESLEVLKVDGVEAREIEYIRRLCGLDNNW